MLTISFLLDVLQKEVNVHPREMFKEVLRLVCTSIIVIHKHPSGSSIIITVTPPQ